LETPSYEIKKYYADPPWPEYGGGKIKRRADRHYPMMKVKDIIALGSEQRPLSDDALKVVLRGTPRLVVRAERHSQTEGINEV